MPSAILAAANDAACTSTDWPTAAVLIVFIIAFAAFLIAMVRS